MTAACRNDDAFGPTVAGCRGGFDFTQLFEVAILSLLPSLLFIVAGAGCFAAQRRRPSVADPDARLRRPPRAALWSRYAPQLVIGGLVAAKCAYVAGLATAPSLRPRSVTLASGALELVMAALLSPLALLGRRRSRYPSDLVCVYLVVTILLDMARCRTLWLLWQSDRPVFAAAVSFTVSLALKVPLLFLTPRGPSHDTDAKASFPTPPSPDTTAGVISISLFWWINPLVRLGYRQALRLDNLYALSPALAMPGPTADTAGDDGALDAPSTVLGLLVHAAGWSALYPVVPRLLLIACVLAQASLTRRVLGLLAAPDDEADPNSKYGLIGATFLVYLCVALATAWYGYLHERVLTRVRGHLIRRVYGHAARLPAAAATGAAKPSTLATVDVESIYNGLRNAHELWALPIQLAFAVWLAYRELGPASLAALAIIAATCAVVAAVAPVAVARQRVWMAALQARVGQTTAVLEALKTLKMAGFTHRAGALLDAARGDELRRGALFRLVVTVSATLSQVPAVAAPVIVFAASRRRLDAASAFTALGYLNVMTQPLTTAIQVVPLVLASWVCLQRIRDFLATPVHIDTCKRGPIPRGFDDEKPPGRNDGGALAVRIADGSFRWAADREPVLRRVGVDVPKSAVVAVVGPVGCGKSTLLQALLGEVAPDAPGSVAVDAARVAYCAQTPVLADGTIRENIIGPLTLNKVRYDEVMEATALVADMAQLPDGDATRLESRGETLSGGQRQRVALARALYHDPDLLLADDVLASLDPGTQLWVARHVFGPEGLLRRRAATVVLATNFDAAVAMADRRLEIAPSGEVTMSLMPSTPPAPTPAATAPRADEKSDGLDETVHALHPAASAESEPSTHGTTGSGRESPAAKAPKSSDAATWAHYFASVGPWSLALYCVLVVGFGATITYPTLWVEKWTSDTSARHPFAYYMGVYGGLAGACIVANLLMGLVALVLFVHRAGTALHRGALRAVLGATMRHLLRTSVGAMLTHFSQDLGIIDGMLAGTLINLSATAAVAAGQAVLIALASPWLAIGYPLVGAALYLLARAYVPTALRLRVLDLEAKGPLVAHLLATAAALATTRAFGRAGSEAARHRRLLGRAQRPSYFLGMAQQWLVLVNNLVVAALATGLVALSTALRTDAAAVGVGLVSLIGLGRVLADMVRAYTMVETALGAVARLAALVRETPQERRGTVTPAESWPATGRLRMTNVSAGYGDGADSGPLALRDVTLSVAPGEKVAIFGRTGSGKSSLLLALLGMLEPQPEGAESIAVDDVPTHQIDGELLRERLIAMPQHAVFLPDGASVRDNLDALGDAPSEACHDALERVGLRAALADLDSVLEPQTLSDGQRQLFSLARCIVRRRARRARGGPEGGLLLLDEIAAHVDAGTAAQMDAIVQAEFGHFTVLAVTHRMPSPGTFQRALVMADGRVVEDGPMEPLLRDQQSRLAALFSAL